MRAERLSSAPAAGKRARLLVVCALLLLSLSQAAVAQSGRRQVKNPSPSAPDVSVEDKAEPKASPTPPKAVAPVASLVITGDRASATFEIPTGYLDIATNACYDTLRKSLSLNVTAGSTNLTRKDAIDEAKKQTEAYVVWLELKAELNAQQNDLAYVVIQFTVFSPQTAKVKYFDSIYLDRATMGSGRVGVGLPPSVSRRFPLDYVMREGGRRVAERLMRHFRVSVQD